MEQRKITDLPAELALRICEFLDVEDLVNACNAIPNWRWIPTSRRSIQAFRRHISNWRWLDKHLYCILFGQSSQTADRNLIIAIKYHSKEMTSLHQHSFQSRSSSPKRPINCCLIFNSYTLRFALLHKQDYHQPILCAIRLINSPGRGQYLLDIIDLKKSSDNTHENECDALICYDEILIRRFKGDILDYDCYVFLMDPQFHSKDHLLHFLDAMRAHQILTIAFLPEAWDDSTNAMHVFAEFIASFDNFADCPLATTAVDWRLCCVKRRDTGEIDLDEWLQFAHYDLQLKGIGNRRKDGSTLPKYLTLRMSSTLF